MKFLSFRNHRALPDGTIDAQLATSWDLLWHAIRTCDYKFLLVKAIGRVVKCFHATDPAVGMITVAAFLFGFMGCMFGFMDMRMHDLTFWLVMKRGTWMTIRIEFFALLLLYLGYETYHAYLRVMDWADKYHHRKTGKYLVDE